jgi:hypothetical protein
MKAVPRKECYREVDVLLIDNTWCISACIRKRPLHHKNVLSYVLHVRGTSTPQARATG